MRSSVRDAVHDAWIAYREFLYRDLHADEAVLAARLAKLARRAKIDADERTAALARVRRHSALLADVTSRYGSLKAYAARRAHADDAELSASLDAALSSYETTRAAHLAKLYEADRRETPLLADVTHRGFLFGAARSRPASKDFRILTFA